MRRTSFSILPALAALSAMFLALPRSGGDVTVTMSAGADGFVYRPAVVRVEPGARITFRNESRVTHTATCDDCPVDTGDVQPGQTVDVTAPGGGSFRFGCRYHGSEGMRGTLDIGPGTQG